jgi:hypothetical protein
MSRTCCNVARRGSEAAGWIVPSILLALVPKCPMCVAAYIALVTGVSITLSTASIVRTSMIVVSIATLMYVAGRRLLRLVK